MTVRRNPVLRVVWQEMHETKVPNKVPEFAKSPFLKGRMKQMRSSLGMSDAEIDALVPDGNKEIENSKRESMVRPEKTWAEIVEEKEKSGKLYSARTIQEAFPYLNGQAQGMPDFKDELREEQLLAHIQAKTNHPMSVMAELQEERFKFFWKSLGSFFFGYWLLKSYLDTYEFEEEVGFRQKDYYLTPHEAAKRIENSEEELVPILRSSRAGYTVVWVPSSKAAQMMWTHREGNRHGQQALLVPSLAEGRLLHPGHSYTFPAQLASLADTQDSQIKWQQDAQQQRDNMLKFSLNS